MKIFKNVSFFRVERGKKCGKLFNLVAKIQIFFHWKMRLFLVIFQTLCLILDLASSSSYIVCNLIKLHFSKFLEKNSHLTSLGTKWSIDTTKLVCSCKIVCNFPLLSSISCTGTSSMTKTMEFSTLIKLTNNEVDREFCSYSTPLGLSKAVTFSLKGNLRLDIDAKFPVVRTIPVWASMANNPDWSSSKL